MKRNITVQLDAEIINKARVVAAKRSTSISSLVAQQIEQAAAQDDDYQRAQTKALEYLENPFHLGSISMPSRESLHER